MVAGVMGLTRRLLILWLPVLREKERKEGKKKKKKKRGEEREDRIKNEKKKKKINTSCYSNVYFYMLL